MKIIIIRHGESIKNLYDWHGDIGCQLTNKGVNQIHSAIKTVAKICKVKPKVVFHSNRQNIVDTATYLSKIWSVSSVLDNRISPMDFGILNGLSRDEALQKYPHPAKSLEKWRQHKCNIDQINIPNAESFDTFLNRVNNFLCDQYNVFPNECICIIGSRSVLMMIINLIIHKADFLPQNYKHIKIPNGFVGYYNYEQEINNRATMEV